MKKRILLIAGFLHLFACNTQKDKKIDLLNLNADKNSPVFTTYAAAMERSSYLLDQGYEFRFYNDEQPIGFFSEQGGDLAFAFIHNGNVLTKLKEVEQEPVINYSFPDMVNFYFYPVKEIRMETTFLVERSNAAVMETTLTNEGSETDSIVVFPYLKNGYRNFTALNKKNGACFFQHEKYPDAWTVYHDLPHVDSIKNYMIQSGNPELEFFNCYDENTAQLPFSLSTDKEQFFQVTGRAYTPEGERYLLNTPEVRIQVWQDKNKDRIITETSPLWGIYEQSVDNGYFRMELGNLDITEKPFNYSFMYYHEPKNLLATYDTIVTKANNGSSLRRDLVPLENNLPEPPVNLAIKEKNGSIELSWTPADNKHYFNVYRRENEKGYFEKVASKIKNASFSDLDDLNATVYRYIVTAIDPETGEEGIHSREAVNLKRASFFDYLKGKEQPDIQSNATYLSFKNNITLQPGESKTIRWVRVSDRLTAEKDEMIDTADSIMSIDFDPYLNYNLDLFRPAFEQVNFSDKEKQLLYISANNLMRQVFYPPEAKSSYNYYVFSREPVWGWGHGGQVFHESITMLAYAYVDPLSAMNSQRVYAERQYENGYINYRTGSYLDEIIEHNDQLTSSAPWYSWLNWEIYKITNDKSFLEEMYPSSKKFYNFYVQNRDSDQDGLCEWGGHAILESVRDALVAVWDNVGWPSNFEGVDLNSMLVMEAKALEKMAKELGLEDEAEKWRSDYEKRSNLINQYCWDEENGFYYNVDKKDNDFTFENTNDLKRNEIIGFLPLWAGVADQEKADKLISHLTDTTEFWRPYGIPSLSASDPYYNDKGYWNGPVWVQWNYLIMRGLNDYGYHQEAQELLDKVSVSMISQLKENHNLWEFYSPDEKWGGYHKTYIWAGIINRMLMDMHNLKND